MALNPGEWARERPDARDAQSSSSSGLLVLDVRRFTPDLVRPLITAIVDEMVALGARDGLMVLSDYESTGLAYQLDMRRETRGLFHYECERRSDGAWVETITRI